MPLYEDDLDIDAARITKGKLHKDRIPWESPGAIGEVTPPKFTCSEFELRTAVEGLIRNYIHNTSDSICGAEFYIAAGPGLEQAITIGLYRYLYGRIDNRSGGPMIMASGQAVSAIFYPSGGTSIGAALSDPGANNLRIQGVTQLGGFTRLTVPNAAAHPGGVLYVADESLGPTLAFSDGVRWLRVHDRTEIA